MHDYNFLLATLLIFYAPMAQAKPSGELQLSSSDAVMLALRDNQSLAAAKATIEEASAYFRYAGRLDNPNLNIGYDSDSAFNNEGEYAYTIGFEQRFPVTNRLKLLKNVSALEVQLAESEFRNQQRLLIRDVELAVDTITSLDHRLSLLKEMVELQVGFAAFLQERIQVGEASILDLNQVQVAQFAVKQGVQNLTKERNIAISELRSLLGQGQNIEIEILPTQSEHIALPPMTDLNGERLNAHPEYQFKTLLAEVAKGKTAIAKAERWADIAIEIFFEEERSVDEPVGLETDRFSGIGVSIPLPLHNRNRAEIQASRLRERKIYHETAALKLRLENEANTLRRNAEATYLQLTKYKESAVGLVEQNLEEINRAYAAGQVDLGEIFRVQEQRLEIKTAQVALRHELNQTLINWRAATASNLSNLPITDISNETN
jgi:cobalt-zinc-cadmium efflux system outer membrane protein